MVISKQEARTYAIKYWQSLPSQRRNKLIDLALLAVENHLHSQPQSRIFATTAFEFELDILNSIQMNFSCDLYLPITKKNRQMDFVNYRVNGEFFELKIGRFGIYEPINTQVEIAKNHDLMIIPSLAVNHGKFRLGRGGGFFDMYFYENIEARSCKKVCILPAELIEIHFSEDSHDIKLDEVVTDTGTIR